MFNIILLYGRANVGNTEIAKKRVRALFVFEAFHRRWRYTDDDVVVAKWAGSLAFRFPIDGRRIQDCGVGYDYKGGYKGGVCVCVWRVRTISRWKASLFSTEIPTTPLHGRTDGAGPIRCATPGRRKYARV